MRAKQWISLSLMGLMTMGCKATDNYALIEGTPSYEEKAATNVLRIGAWVAPPSANWNGKGNPDFNTEERFQEVADSGINISYSLYQHTNRAETIRAAKNATAAGIKYLARDIALNIDPIKMETEPGELHAQTQGYDGEESFEGFLVRDEPSANDFASIANLHEFYKNEYPGKEFYINLFPTYASTSQTGTTDYKEYIDRYIEQVKPSFISYDHYALHVDGYGNYKITPDVLWNLEIVAERCKAAGIPMYTFVSDMSYGSTSREPNREELRWQVLTQLVYGSRSIQYFCYWTPLEFAEGSPSMITVDGKKTDHYHDVQAVNQELSGLDEAYLDYSWQSTMPIYGSANQAKSNKQFSMLEHPSESLEGLKDISASQDSLIGYFQNDEGREAYMIMNFDDPHHGNKDEIQLTFRGANKVLIYHYGIAERLTLNGGVLKYTLDPGDGIFAIPYKE